MSKKILLSGCIFILLMFSLASICFANFFEGFEGGKGNWYFPDKSWSDNNTTLLDVSTEFASEGKNSLRVDFAGAGSKIYAVTEGEWDMSSLSSISLDLYNTTDDGSAVVAVCTGDAYFWWESSPIPVKNGWNKGLTFDLTAASWKSASTGWAFTSKPKGLKSVKRLVVLFYEGSKKSGSVYIDNINLNSNATSATASITSEDKKAASDKAIAESRSAEQQASKVMTNGSVTIETGKKTSNGYLKPNTNHGAADVEGSYTQLTTELNVKTDDGLDVYLKGKFADGYTPTLSDSSNAPYAFLDTGHVSYGGLKVFYGEKWQGSDVLGDPFKLYYCENRISEDDQPDEYGVTFNKSVGNLGINLLYMPHGKLYYDKAYKNEDPSALTAGRLTYGFDAATLGFTFSHGYVNHWDYKDSTWSQKSFKNDVYATDLTVPLPISNLGTLKVGYAYDASAKDQLMQQNDGSLGETDDTDAIFASLSGINFGPLFFYFEYGDFGRGFYNTGGEWNLHNSKKHYANVFWQAFSKVSFKLAYDGFEDKDWPWTGKPQDYGKWIENWTIFTVQTNLSPFTITAEYAVDPEECPLKSKPSYDRKGIAVDYAFGDFYAKLKFDQKHPTSDINNEDNKTNKYLATGLKFADASNLELSYGHYEFCLLGKTGIIDSFVWQDNTEKVKLTYTKPLFKAASVILTYENDKDTTTDKHEDIYSLGLKHSF